MLFWKLDSCRKSLKIGVERQRQDDVQTGDKVQVKQNLISPSFLTPPPPRNRHERSHFYINLTFRMLFNIHFQSFNLKWPSQIRDHSLFMPRGSGWQKGGGLIQKFRNEGEAGGGEVTKGRNVGILELEHMRVLEKLTDRELGANCYEEKKHNEEECKLLCRLWQNYYTNWQVVWKSDKDSFQQLFVLVWLLAQEQKFPKR